MISRPLQEGQNAPGAFLRGATDPQREGWNSGSLQEDLAGPLVRQTGRIVHEIHDAAHKTRRLLNFRKNA